MAFYCYHTVNEYARIAARYAEVHGITCVKGDGTSCYMGDNNADGTNTTLYNVLQGAGLLGVSTSNLIVKPTFTFVPSRTTCINTPGCNGSGDQVTVTVTYTFPYTVPFVMKRNLTMVSSSTMTISQ